MCGGARALPRRASARALKHQNSCHRDDRSRLGPDRWCYKLDSDAASVLQNASTSFASTGSWSVQALLPARFARSVQS